MEAGVKVLGSEYILAKQNLIQMAAIIYILTWQIPINVRINISMHCYVSITIVFCSMHERFF